MNVENVPYKQSPRKQQVAELIVSGKTYQQAADILGISRQRVQQLNRPDPNTIERLIVRSNGKCEECGVCLEKGHIHHISKVSLENYHSLSNLKYLCVSCHRSNDAIHRDCPVCGIPFKCGYNRPINMFCSKKCFKEYYNVTLTCRVCGKKFTVNKSDYKVKLRIRKIDGFFCSKICYGKWWGKNYGFGSEKGYKNRRGKE